MAAGIIQRRGREGSSSLDMAQVQHDLQRLPGRAFWGRRGTIVHMRDVAAFAARIGSSALPPCPGAALVPAAWA